MSEVKVIQINESVFAQNDRAAELIRKKLTEQGTLFLNFMSSPGSGKTTTLVALINRLKDRLNIGEMDVDIETSLDAQHVADRTGIRSLQIHNGGLCHIDADMTARALEMLVSTVYQVSGKTDADPKEAAASLLPYFKSSGGTVQNLLKLCDKIVKTNKSVITDEITTDWKFYTPTTSMRTNAALRFKAFMQELSKAIVTDDKTITGKVNTAVKDTIDKIVNSVDTKNYTEPYVTAAKKAVKDKVSGILSNVLQKAVATVKNTIKTIAGGGKLPIIKW